MKSDTNDVQQMFQDRRQYRVPFYQRSYVWSKEEQWDPLWSDISDKADVRSGGQIPAPHFLGAIVLEPQPRPGLRGVETYNIIDGQQRLTTLQYFLAALLLATREAQLTATQPLIEGCVWNPNPDTMIQPEIERFKVWPTFRDRTPYRAAMNAESRGELRQLFPASFTQGATLKKIGIDHPPALEAIWFFGEQIDEWCQPDTSKPGTNSERLEWLTEAVLRDLKFVTIALEQDDDAQVIFETLNGRGAELNATDLVRNFIFMRADREDADGSALYDTLWTPFENATWTEELRRGRLKKPRLEWFVQTALQAELAEPVEIGRLYTHYRRYALSPIPPVKAEAQLRMLTKHADNYRQLTSPAAATETPIGRFGQRMSAWDTSAVHPLALRLATIGVGVDVQQRIFDDIVSYIVRRAMCGLTIKNYNNLFLQLLKRVPDASVTAEGFRQGLSSLKGETSRWPRDDEFRSSWLQEAAHSRLGDVARVRAVLAELENAKRSPRTEEPYVPSAAIDVDHILPDKWYEHWAMDDKTFVTPADAQTALYARFSPNEPDARTAAINRRERLKTTIGNLTLVHYGVNRSAQNREFEEKRKKLFAESNLHLNRDLMVATGWNEASIETRGQTLFALAREVWRAPMD